ncbi:MAG: DMT family transporter, partial [Caenispirillum bisanense]|nr:DMT family transporter [Caenispirillum bisanense]
ARTLLALALAVGGTVLLVGVPEGDAGSQVLLGVLLASGAAASYATVVISGRSMAGSVHPYQTIIFGFGGGALCLLPFAASAGIGVSDTAIGVPLLIYLGVVTTGLSYMLFFTGMKTTPATAASIVTLLEALTATLLAWIIFGERLGPLGVVGGVLLVAGMLVLTLRRRD